jgi:NADPH:quinone reductase-like Zn-dependent oxidoreductase
MMAQMGVLVLEWPLVIGADASGIVVEAGDIAQSKYGLNKGSYVCGCTRLGRTQYATGQEYFLMDAQVTMRKPHNISLPQAATLGAGIETAALAIFQGLQVPLFDPQKEPEEKAEWMIVLGGGSSVGWYAIQMLKAAGYKVLASCSQRSTSSVKSLGAEAFDYRDDLEKQLKDVFSITGGKIAGVFDAAASADPAIAKKLFAHDSWHSSKKLFATTNDWSNVGSFGGGQTYEVELGPIGRPDSPLNKIMESYIPLLIKLVENGRVKPGEYEVVGDGGFEDLVKAYKAKAGGASGQRKIVVKIQDE